VDGPDEQDDTEAVDTDESALLKKNHAKGSCIIRILHLFPKV
jgi:hypothetical protein